MQILQIIGKPGVGKSTLIRYIKRENPLWDYFDIAAHNEESDTFLSAENTILKAIIRNGNDCIIESACGFNELTSKVIRCTLEHNKWVDRLKVRHPKVKDLDELLDYYSMLESQSLVPDEVLDLSETYAAEAAARYIIARYMTVEETYLFN